MGYSWDIPPGYVKIAIENGPVEIVDLPNYKMLIFYSYVSLPEASTWERSWDEKNGCHSKNRKTGWWFGTFL